MNTKNRLKNIFGLFFLFFASGAWAQDAVTLSRVVIFTDGASITQKGIVRFSEKKARFVPQVMPNPTSVEIIKSNDYHLQYMRFAEVMESQSMPVTGWSDVLEANIGKMVVVTYQIGAEYDEVSGEILDINRTSNMFLLRNKSAQDIFISLDQVRQVLVDASPGTLSLKRMVPKSVIEVGIDKDIQFGAIEFAGNIPGLSWSPNCRIRLGDSKNAKFQMSAVVTNASKSTFENVECELAAGKLKADLMDAKASSWRYQPGKISLKPSESIFLNLSETSLEYEVSYNCYLPWKGPAPELRTEPQPVVHLLKFLTPVSTAVACESVAVLDAEGKFLTEAKPAGGEITTLQLGQEGAIKVVYQENGEYESAKTVKQGDKNMRKIKFTGKIIISSLKADPVSIKITRELSGDLLNTGNANIEANEKAFLKNVVWTRLVRPGSSETITYEYNAYLPVE